MLNATAKNNGARLYANAWEREELSVVEQSRLQFEVQREAESMVSKFLIDWYGANSR
jgi:hypothetical protein